MRASADDATTSELRQRARATLHADAVPDVVGRAVVGGRDAWRRATAGLRALPDFVVIGVHKGGTTALYDYLAAHPQVVPAITKEVHYFDQRYDGDPRTYRAAFPVRWRVGPRPGGRAVTGEATPSYFNHPHVPPRLAAMLGDVPLVVLLRDPVARVASAFHHNRRRTPWEPLPTLEQAVERELTTYVGEYERLRADVLRDPAPYLHHCYLHRSDYLPHLLRWEEHVPPEQLLVLRFEDLVERPDELYEQVLRDLGLDPGFTLPSFQPRNANAYRGLDPDLHRRLRRHFAEPVAALEDHLGRSMRWGEP